MPMKDPYRRKAFRAFTTGDKFDCLGDLIPIPAQPTAMPLQSGHTFKTGQRVTFNRIEGQIVQTALGRVLVRWPDCSTEWITGRRLLQLKLIGHLYHNEEVII